MSRCSRRGTDCEGGFSEGRLGFEGGEGWWERTEVLCGRWRGDRELWEPGGSPGKLGAGGGHTRWQGPRDRTSWLWAMGTIGGSEVGRWPDDMFTSKRTFWLQDYRWVHTNGQERWLSLHLGHMDSPGRWSGSQIDGNLWGTGWWGSWEKEVSGTSGFLVCIIGSIFLQHRLDWKKVQLSWCKDQEF